MKSTALNYLVIGILSYYLIKGLIFLLMWQTLVVMEDKGKKRIAREKEEREAAFRRRREIRENTKPKS
jgi:hypothetical protein